MKKVSLMQPYLFPYIGYFQLINAVDLFIVYDDVQWIKGGWINRNRILADGEPHYVTLPVKKDSHSKNINKREFASTVKLEKERTLDEIKDAYRDAPCFNGALPLIKKIFTLDEQNVAIFITNSIREICNYLGISAEIALSSDLDKNQGLRSQDRVVDICKTVEAGTYINAIGGKDLYDKASFAQQNIKLSFIQSSIVEYEQFANEFTPNLSIIDVMMFNDVNTIKNMLDSYELI